jgi:hypothetical protein
MDTFRDLSRFSSRIDFLGTDVVGVNRDRRDVISKRTVCLFLSKASLLQFKLISLDSNPFINRNYHIIVIFCLGLLDVLDLR